MEECSDVSHYAEEPQGNCFGRVVADLQDVVDLVHEFEQIQDLAVLRHRVIDTETHQLILSELPHLSESSSRIPESSLNFLDVGVDLASVDELGDVLDHGADFVSSFAGSENRLEVLCLLDDHLSALDDLDTLFPNAVRRFDLRYAISPSLTLTGGVSSQKTGILICELFVD